MTTTVSTRKAGNTFFAGAFAAMALAVTGCASTNSGAVVGSQASGQSVTVREGQVAAVREVTIRPDRSIVGTATGAVLGGIAGSELGGGDKANAAGAIAGAVIGGIAGNFIGQSAGTQQGQAVTVDFGGTDGLRAYIQPLDYQFQPGMPVFVEFREDGAYVVPAPARRY
ncbi:MAG: glycine zipper 2TM domain-containing protein [Pseudomonadota bacterium]